MYRTEFKTSLNPGLRYTLPPPNRAPDSLVAFRLGLYISRSGDSYYFLRARSSLG